MLFANAIFCGTDAGRSVMVGMDVYGLSAFLPYLEVEGKETNVDESFENLKNSKIRKSATELS